MFAEERRSEIARIVKQDERILAGSLAEKFKVSIDTIRRDLSMMEDKGLLKRTHGGAINAMKVRALPPDALLLYNEGSPKQNAVAKLAVSFIGEGDTVYIGGAGIHCIMLKYLPLDISFSVVTNSIIIADRLKDFENIETYMACGKVRKQGNILDALTIEFIRSLRMDTAFLTGGGLTVGHGLSNATPEGTILHKAVAEVSKRKIYLATFDKLGYESFARSMDAKGLDLVITDWEAPQGEIDKLRGLGVKVLVASHTS